MKRTIQTALCTWGVGLALLPLIVLAFCGCAETKGKMQLPNGAQAEASFTRMFWTTGEGNLEFDPSTGKVLVSFKKSEPHTESINAAMNGAMNLGKLILLAGQSQQPTNSPATSTNKTMLIEFVK